MGCCPSNRDTRRAHVEALERRYLLSAQLVDVLNCPDDRLLTVAYDPQSSELEITRFNGDGSRDSNFGAAGRITQGIELPKNGDELKGRMAVDPQSGRIVIAFPGDGHHSFNVAMFTETGAADTTFGDGGSQLREVKDLHGLVMTTDGRIAHASDYFGSSETDNPHWTIRSAAYPSGTEGPKPWSHASQSVGQSSEQLASASTSIPGAEMLGRTSESHSSFETAANRSGDAILVSHELPAGEQAATGKADEKESTEAPIAAAGATPTAAYLASYLADRPSENQRAAKAPAMKGAADVLAAGVNEKSFFMREPTDPTLGLDVDLLAGNNERASMMSLNHRGSLIVRTNNNRGEQVSVYVRGRDGKMIVRVDNYARAFVPRRIRRIAIYTAGGDDAITIGPDVRSVYVDAGDGNDTIHGGQFSDVLVGGQGKDQIFGHDGDDILVGGPGNDLLVGGAGKDDLYGHGGVDTLNGCGGNDRLDGGAGADVINGGPGDDAAKRDDEDTYTDVERWMD